MSNIETGDVDAIVDAWLKYHQCHLEANDLLFKFKIGEEHFWAIEKLIQAARNNPELCWVSINKILEKIETPFFEASLAAGPLEDLLTEHGESIIDRIVTLSSTNEKFRHLLGGVWRSTIEKKVWNKIEKIRNGSW
jgi:hypothetical protein